MVPDDDEAVEEISESVFMHLPDTDAPDPEPLEEDEGYHTDDDLSELEGDEFQESLKKGRMRLSRSQEMYFMSC